MATDLGFHSQQDLVDAGGPSLATIRQLFAMARRGAPVRTFMPDTLRRLDTALRWEQGSARAVMAGGEPRPLPTTGAPQVGVIRGTDPQLGEYRIALPSHVLAVLDELSPLQRAEIEVDLVAHLLAKIREARSAGATP